MSLQKYISNNNANIQLKQIPGKGRGLIYSPGEGEKPTEKRQIMIQGMIVGQSLKKVQEKRCSECLITKESYIQCSLCRYRIYCSTECSKINWFKKHFIECKYIQEFGLVDRELEDLIIDFFLTKWACEIDNIKRSSNKKHSEDYLLYLNEFKYEKVFYETGLFYDLYPSGRPETELDRITVNEIYERLNGFYSKQVKLFVKKGIKRVEKKEILLVLSIAKNNSFDINLNHESIGFCNLPLASFLNHSCEPNCIINFEYNGTRRQNSFDIITTRQIKPNEELTISYCDVILPKDRRKQLLMDKYNFVCNCNKCSDLIVDYSLLDEPKLGNSMLNINTYKGLEDKQFSYIEMLHQLDQLDVLKAYMKVVFTTKQRRMIECYDKYKKLIYSYSLFENVSDKLSVNKISDIIDKLKVNPCLHELDTNKLVDKINFNVLNTYSGLNLTTCIDQFQLPVSINLYQHINQCDYLIDYLLIKKIYKSNYTKYHPLSYKISYEFIVYIYQLLNQLNNNTLPNYKDNLELVKNGQILLFGLIVFYIDNELPTNIFTRLENDLKEYFVLIQTNEALKKVMDIFYATLTKLVRSEVI
ncbi:hypothetical protein K502DRAFT_362079 [Neoconidiobolus thromboides FSU 785]|nr:hypothetical protein K502DRAFT_362079 [Neoconidiobolus thromboides FSU 785]